MKRLIQVSSKERIPGHFRDTPVGKLLEYHNLNRTMDLYTSAESSAKHSDSAFGTRRS